MFRNMLTAFCAAVFLLVMLVQFGCTQEGENKMLTHEELIARGKYIVETGACNDCHTPRIFTPKGVTFDTSRYLAGFPQEYILPSLDINIIKDKWVGRSLQNAFVGAWGISYASNLTPDNATGLGAVTEEMFIKTLREGKLKGVGRQLLPPMPWQDFGKKTDEDLKAIYAFLKSIKPVSNLVPQPVLPDKLAEVLATK